jgi:diadenosine tetraphosphate (Ap4A) HIT family hydrolase
MDPARMVHHLNRCLAFYDAYPVSPGHTLVVPAEFVASIFDLPEERQADLWEVVAEVREILRQRHQPDGFTVGINDGPAAGQTIHHAHIHIIPRYKGDVPDPRGGIRWVIPEKAIYWKDQQS